MAKNQKKKPAQQVQSILETLREKGRELGVDSKTAVSRLATTIKAEMPTLILDQADKNAAADKAEKKKKHEAVRGPSKPGIFSERLKSNVAKVAHQLNPLGEPAGARKVARELKHLQKQIIKAQRPVKAKVRRSRLPFVVAFVVLLVLGGGLWAFRAVSGVLPSVKVSQVLDYKKWFEHTAGKTKHAKEPALTVKAHGRAPVAKSEPKREPQPLVIHVVNPPIPHKVLTKQSSRGAVGKKMAQKSKRATLQKAPKARVKTVSYKPKR